MEPKYFIGEEFGERKQCCHPSGSEPERTLEHATLGRNDEEVDNSNKKRPQKRSQATHHFRERIIISTTYS